MAKLGLRRKKEEVHTKKVEQKKEFPSKKIKDARNSLEKEKEKFLKRSKKKTSKTFSVFEIAGLSDTQIETLHEQGKSVSENIQTFIKGEEFPTKLKGIYYKEIVEGLRKIYGKGDIYAWENYTTSINGVTISGYCDILIKDRGGNIKACVYMGEPYEIQKSLLLLGGNTLIFDTKMEHSMMLIKIGSSLYFENYAFNKLDKDLMEHAVKYFKGKLGGKI